MLSFSHCCDFYPIDLLYYHYFLESVFKVVIIFSPGTSPQTPSDSAHTVYNPFIGGRYAHATSFGDG